MPTFAPSVMIDGQSYEPPGWMWVFALAVNNVPWAVDRCLEASFDRLVKDWLIAQHVHLQEERIIYWQRSIDECYEEIRHLRSL